VSFSTSTGLGKDLFSQRVQANGGVLKTLTIIEPDKLGQTVPLLEKWMLTFFWPPDNKMVAYFLPAGNNPGLSAGNRQPACGVLVLEIRGRMEVNS